MKIDMSPESITKRLKIVSELRRTCLALANSDVGKEIMRKRALAADNGQKVNS